jgi:hypothetical protein
VRSLPTTTVRVPRRRASRASGDQHRVGQALAGLVGGGAEDGREARLDPRLVDGEPLIGVAPIGIGASHDDCAVALAQLDHATEIKRAAGHVVARADLQVVVVN